MKKQLTLDEKREILVNVLKEHDENYAIFGLSKELVNPLIKKGLLHKDTFRYTGGAKLTKAGRKS